MMKRSMIALLLVFALCMGLFSGCGKKEGDESSSTDEMARREIVELTMYIPGTASEDTSEQQMVNKIKDSILSEFSGYQDSLERKDVNEVDLRLRVEQKLFPIGSPENEEVKREILSGQGPDMFYFIGGVVSPFQYESALEDLEPYFDKSDRVKLEDLQQTVLNAGRIRGKLKTLIYSYNLPVFATTDRLLSESGLENLETLEFGYLNQTFSTPQILGKGEDFLLMSDENSLFAYQPYGILEMLMMGHCVQSYFNYNSRESQIGEQLKACYQDYSALISREDMQGFDSPIDGTGQTIRNDYEKMQEGSLLFQLQSQTSAIDIEGSVPKGFTLTMPGEKGNYAMPMEMLSICSTASKENQERAFGFLEHLLMEHENGGYAAVQYIPTVNRARELRSSNWEKGKSDLDDWQIWYYDQAENISSCNIFDEYYYTQVFQPIMEDEGKPLEQRVRELENRTNLYLKE